MFGYLEAVTVLTAATFTDRFGNDAADWDNATTRTEQCLVALGGSTEPLLVDRDQVDSDFDLIFPDGIDPAITAQNRVKVRGLVCDVNGRPFTQAWGSSPGLAGTVVKVSIREG